MRLDARKRPLECESQKGPWIEDKSERGPQICKRPLGHKSERKVVEAQNESERSGGGYNGKVMEDP